MLVPETRLLCMMQPEQPRLLLVAGPNGAGKTTVTERGLAHEWFSGCEYINPDFIARDQFGDWNSQSAVIQAANFASELRENCLASQRTGGKILMSDGQGLGVDGLTKFIAVFDKSETLVAVIMTMPKNVNSTYSKLSEKYKPVSKNVDEFMGFGTAKLEKGDSFIVLEAPHLSFAMDVVYATKEFMATSERNTAETRAKNEQEQKDKL